MKTTLIHPATFKLDGGAMFGIIPKPLWSKKIKPDDLNRIPMALRVVLIQTKNRNILIDTGIGDYHPEKFVNQFEIISSPSPIVRVLNDNLKIQAGDITDIILTHLHFDHVGGLGGGEKGTDPIFKNATIHINKNHYEYSLSPTLRDSGSFQKHFFKPIIDWYLEKGQVNFLSGNDGVIIEDEGEKVTYKESFGHTPYMIHPIFDKYIYMADLVPMSHHIKLPWVMGYDIEPGTTTVYKKQFYDYIMANNLNMIFEHDLDIWGGPLEINDRGQYQLKDTFLSQKETTQILE
jgi:glyoxylase-like metal-dependent hydrolase (beta-lactamase superfamily II)